MTELLKRLVTDFNYHLTWALIGSIGFSTALLFLRWFYNKRKFNKLAHQIPASVVKNYLDSIIQNSNSLKSSLFRGGGLDMGEGVPSVLPVSGLGGGESVTVDTATKEELNQKLAEISSLKSQLNEKQNMITELEGKLANAPTGEAPVDDGAKDAQIQALQTEIEELKAQLAQAQANAGGDSGGGDAELQGQLSTVTKERDELKEKLQEYEIIEDDLANLKRLQQENTQLKAALEKAGGSVADATVEAPSDAPAEESAAEEPAAEEPAAEEPAAEAAAEGEENPNLEGEEKSAEDLLSEFEKMLG